MKLIYSQGFSKNEKLEWKPVVFSNIVQSFKVIFEAMQELQIDFENPDNEVSGLFSRQFSRVSVGTRDCVAGRCRMRLWQL
jgi:hypothetical protein